MLTNPLNKLTTKIKCANRLLISNIANGLLKCRLNVLSLNLKHISSSRPYLRVFSGQKMDSYNFEMYQVIFRH